MGTKKEHVKLKPKKAKEVQLHPAAESWNVVLEKLEETRKLWSEHREAYIKNRRSVSEASISTQKQLAGIVHQQRFSAALDWFTRYADAGFSSLVIKE